MGIRPMQVMAVGLCFVCQSRAAQRPTRSHALWLCNISQVCPSVPPGSKCFRTRGAEDAYSWVWYEDTTPHLLAPHAYASAHSHLACAGL